MGIVKYKFTFDENKINMPIMIAFGYQLANIESDSENKIGEVSGYVEDVDLEYDNLRVYVEVRGKLNSIWKLEVTYEGSQIEEFPIVRAIPKGNESIMDLVFGFDTGFL